MMRPFRILQAERHQPAVARVLGGEMGMKILVEELVGYRAME